MEEVVNKEKNLKLGQPVDLSKKPKIIKPEYIYGCSTKERNEIFILLINAYKQKREQNKNLDEQKLKNLDYIISSLEKAYKEESQIFNIKQNYAKLLNENNYLLKENNNLSQKLKEINIPNIIGKRAKSPTYNIDLIKYKYKYKYK